MNTSPNLEAAKDNPSLPGLTELTLEPETTAKGNDEGQNSEINFAESDLLGLDKAFELAIERGWQDQPSKFPDQKERLRRLLAQGQTIAGIRKVGNGRGKFVKNYLDTQAGSRNSEN